MEVNLHYDKYICFRVRYDYSESHYMGQKNKEFLKMAEEVNLTDYNASGT
jgi:hypothetical protein